MDFSFNEVPTGFLMDLFDLMEEYEIKEITWDIDLYDCPPKGLFLDGRIVRGLVFKSNDSSDSEEEEEKEPKTVFSPSDKEKKLKPFQQVLVRDDDEEEWDIEIFSHYNNEAENFPYATLDGGVWMQCIPYEGNEELFGTTKAN